MAAAIGGESGDALLAKERPGCLSLWRRESWEAKQKQTAGIVGSKLASGRLDRRLAEVQRLGRLLSTRQRPVQLAARGRLVIPEGFRDLLGVEAGGDVVVVGAAICVEVWNPTAWADLIGEEMPGFRDLLEDLAG
ncbi:MAG: division/cell wall cluster transcriptional repressor MraZ [Planctomycetota bacterium]